MSDTPPDPPASLGKVTTQTLYTGSEIERFYNTRFRPAEFNPCLGDPSRFAPIRAANGKCIPSLYAAQSRDAAAYETVFRGVPLGSSNRPARLSLRRIHHYGYARLRVLRNLTMITLFNVPLRGHGVTRKQLIESDAAHYTQTTKWAEAFRVEVPEADGLVWTSRRDDRAKAYLLFGDRVNETDFEILDTRRLADDPNLVSELRAAARQGGITLVR